MKWMILGLSMAVLVSAGTALAADDHMRDHDGHDGAMPPPPPPAH